MTLLPLGTLVYYWRGERAGQPSGIGKTRSEVFILCGGEVVWIEGCSGCIALSHVQVVPEPHIIDELVESLTTFQEKK